MMIKEQLLAGKSARYRSSGWSLWPRVHNNDACTYRPVTSDDQVHVDDIVFCEVQPNNRFYAHLVKRKEWDADRSEWKFIISNNVGRENGWAYMETIYGKLSEVMH